MRRKQPPTPPPPHLREDAESALTLASPAVDVTLQPNYLLHELQVHQIELEMQNEALRQAQIALEESRDRYMDLYEFAPVGYLTIGNSGLITEANLTGAALFGENRAALRERRFASFVMPEDRDVWHRHLLHLSKYSGNRTCELRLTHSDGTIFRLFGKTG